MKPLTLSCIFFLFFLSGASAKLVTLSPDPLPSEDAQIILERNATESYWDVSYNRINRTTWEFALSLPPRMQADMIACRANISACNLTYIRAQYVPPQYSVSDNGLRMIIGNLTTVPLSALNGTRGSKATIDVLNGDTINVTYTQFGARFNIGFGTLSTYTADSTTHLGFWGRVTEGTYTGGTRFAFNGSSYNNLSSSDNSRLNTTGGSTTLDTYVLVNFTLPANRSYIDSILITAEGQTGAAGNANCTLSLRNFTNGVNMTINYSQCSSSTEVTLTYNLTGINLTSYIDSSNRLEVRFWANSTTITDSVQADYMKLDVYYDQPSVLNWTLANHAPMNGTRYLPSNFTNVTPTSGSLIWNSTAEAYIFQGLTNCFQIPNTLETNLTFFGTGGNANGTTFTAWVRGNSTHTTTPVILNTRFNFGSALGQLFQFDSTELLKLWMGATTITSSTATATAQTWEHFAAVHNFTSGQVMYYENGVNTDNQSLAPKNASTSNSFIGCEAASNNVFNGTLKDIRMYNISLNPQEVRQVYLNRTDVRCDGLRLWYPFTKNAQVCGSNAVGFGI